VQPRTTSTRRITSAGSSSSRKGKQTFAKIGDATEETSVTAPTTFVRLRPGPDTGMDLRPAVVCLSPRQGGFLAGLSGGEARSLMQELRA
jgi:hypothetical protein